MGKLLRVVRRVPELARKELTIHERLHLDSLSTLRRLEARSSEFAHARSDALGWAVFPSVGASAVVLGAGYGLGEVFERGRLIGYAGLVQGTLGVQLGGQTFAEVVLFHDRAAFRRFKESHTGLALEAAATIVRAGAAASRRPGPSTSVYRAHEGGLWAGAAVGAQKLIFRPAVLTRSKAVRRILSALPSVMGRTPARGGGR